VFAVEPAEAAPEGEPGDTGHRDDPEGGRQPELLRLVVELAQRQSCLGFRRSPRRIDPDAFHGRQVEHQTAIGHGVARDAVSTATHRKQEIVRPGEVDSLDHVGGAPATDDHRRALVDHPVEDGASSIVAVVFRAYELAAQVGRELLHGSFFEGLAHGHPPMALPSHHNPPSFLRLAPSFLLCHVDHESGSPEGVPGD
jgi:hypothetical protein